jgi:hypothetical protein
LLLKFTKSWLGKLKKLGLLRQFWTILIFHGNPASRQDYETLMRKVWWTWKGGEGEKVHLPRPGFEPGTPAWKANNFLEPL